MLRSGMRYGKHTAKEDTVNLSIRLRNSSTGKYEYLDSVTVRGIPPPRVIAAVRRSLASLAPAFPKGRSST